MLSRLITPHNYNLRRVEKGLNQVSIMKQCRVVNSEM